MPSTKSERVRSQSLRRSELFIRNSQSKACAGASRRESSPPIRQCPSSGLMPIRSRTSSPISRHSSPNYAAPLQKSQVYDRPSSFAAQIDWSVIVVGIVNEWTYHAILDRLDTGRGPSSIFHCVPLVPTTDLSLKEHLVALAHSDSNCASFDFGMPLQRFLDFPLYVLSLNARLDFNSVGYATDAGQLSNILLSLLLLIMPIDTAS